MSTPMMKTPAALLVLLLMGLSLGAAACGVDGHTRQAQYTHWHDEDTVILVYTRQQTMGTFAAIFMPTPVTTHVRVCTVEENNALACEHQREVSNILNTGLSDQVDINDQWRR